MIPASRIEVLVWVLLYGGLIAVGLGIAVQRSDAMLGWGIAIVGGAAVALGAVLIVVRARMRP
jgi:hypothetical protein